MKRKSIFFLVYCILAICVSTQLHGQQQTPSEDLFKVTPVSPNTAALGLYGHTPVGHYTGTPNINIPLYEIDLDGKKIPISISYHASGIRVAQEASSIGLGWSLNLGGCITKVVNGEDDFVPTNNAFESFYYDPVSLDDLYNTVYQSDKLTGNVFSSYPVYLSSKGKGEPDMYYYNFAGYSGKMFFDRIGTVYKGFQNTSSKAKAVLLSPKAHIDVVYNLQGSGGFTVKDADGYTYGFERTEASTNYYLATSGRLTYDEQALREIPFLPGDYQVTAYYLTYIESPKKNRVTFNYADEYLYTPVSLNEQVYYTNSAAPMLFYRYDVIPRRTIHLSRSYYDFTYSYNRIQQLRPTSVTFNGGSIQISTADRTDLQTVPGQAVPKRISGLAVKDAAGTVIKSFAFEQSYRGNNNQTERLYLYNRLMLDQVVENNGAQHTFTYNSATLPPKNSLETDFWGFYNQGQLEGSPVAFETAPSSSLLGTILYGRNKRPKTSLLQNMMLTNIQYPTGGTTTFTYEPHVLNLEFTHLAQQIKSEGISTAVIGQDYNNPCNIIGTTGKDVVKDFELNRGIGGAVLNFRVTNNTSTGPSCGGSSTGFSVWLEVFDGTNYVPYKDGYGQPKIYTFTVAHSQLNYEYSDNNAFSTGLKAGKYRLKLRVGIPGYTNFSAFAGLQYMGFDTVKTEVSSGAGLRIKKIVDKDGNKEEIRHFGYSVAKLMYMPTFSWPQFVSPDFFILSSVPGYSSRLTSFQPSDYYVISNTSSLIPFSNAAQGSIVGYYSVKEYFGENKENGHIEYMFENLSNTPSGIRDYFPFYYSKEHLLNGSLLRKSTFNGDSVIVQNEVLDYKTTDIKNVTSFKIFKPRPLDLIDGAIFGFYNIEVEESVLESKTLTSYNEGQIAQIINEVYTYDPNYSLLVSTQTTNSKGKSTNQMIKYPFHYTDGISTGMVSKNLMGIPIEKIRLVDNKVVGAYKTLYKDTLGMYLPAKTYSFKSTSPQTLSAYANYYQLDHTFTKYNNKGRLLEFINPNRTLTTYLWNTSSLYPIAIVQNAGYNQTINAFQNFNMSGIGTVDTNKELQVRSNLPNAWISTYTYKPLVGMTSMTDPRGITEYYKYDGFQRLKNVLDFEGNVLGEYQYHYRP